MSLWHDLIRKYATHSIDAPDLKIVTLAQWALESGFGTSALATDHLNFGGLKFRARVNRDRPLAEPVDYMAHDGLDTYCAFASLEDFIDGYWAFIDNGSFYDGWRAFAEDPSGYIGHLKAGGYAGDPNYVAKVLGVVPRIRKEINDLGLSAVLEADDALSATKKRVAVLIGHNSKSQGAYSDDMQVSEWVYNKRVYAKMAALQGEYGIELKQFFRNKSSSYSKEIADAYSAIDAWSPEIIVELHFNSGGGHGSEMLYWHTSASGKALASAVQNAVVEALGRPSRGLKPRKDGERGSTSLQASIHPTILTEPFFGDSAGDTARMLALGEEPLARAYLIGLRDYLEDA
ncbi:glucosaminidase domain-containing protein [Roseibium sp.]|uniref:glucosaminidase domain-containing protein n=1 Tax=Roseibium sp. TaxID=1936156 RepID=UPI003BB050F1